MAKALLVIDLQEGYIEKYPSLLLTCINGRITRATADKELIVYVKNTKRLRCGRKTNKLTAIDSVQNGYKTILQYEYIGVRNVKRFEKTKKWFGH